MSTIIKISASYSFLQRSLLLIVTALLFMSTTTYAKRYDLPQNPHHQTVGKVEIIYSEPGESLQDIATRKKISYNTLKKANPHLQNKLRAWTRVKLPGIALPSKRTGIVINRIDNHLYYFPEGGQHVWIFPVAVGRSGWETPLGESKITEKRKDPIWYVPESIQMAAEEKGVFLPDVMRSSPHNPLGKFAMRTGLAKSTILIHGTNDPSSIGKKVSSGCIRMFNEDVGKLFEMVQIGASVAIIEEYLDHHHVRDKQPTAMQRQQHKRHLASEQVLGQIVANKTARNRIQ